MMNIGPYQGGGMDIGPFQSGAGEEAGATSISFSGSLFIEGLVNSHSGSIDLFTVGPLQSSGSIDLFITGPYPTGFSGSVDLFVTGPYPTGFSGSVDLLIAGSSQSSDSVDLFITGSLQSSDSIDLFINGLSQSFDSVDLFVIGLQQSSGSIDLFTGGQSQSSDSMDLFTVGPLQSSGSIDLFITGPYPTGFSGSTDLFISSLSQSSGSINLFITSFEAESGIPLRIINRLTKTGDYDPQLVGIFTTSPSGVNIEVWDTVDGQNTQVTIANSGCYAIGNTGRWAWSTANLPFTNEHKKYQYYFRMTSNTDEKQYGEFFITVPERGRWSHP